MYTTLQWKVVSQLATSKAHEQYNGPMPVISAVVFLLVLKYADPANSALLSDIERLGVFRLNESDVITADRFSIKIFHFRDQIS